MQWTDDINPHRADSTPHKTQDVPRARTGGLGLAVGDVVVDLVRDKGDALLVTILAEPLELLGGKHRARGVGGGGEDEALHLLPPPEPQALHHPLKLLGRDLKVVVHGHRHHLAPQRGEDVAVAGVARAGDADHVPRVEGGEEGDSGLFVFVFFGRWRVGW